MKKDISKGAFKLMLFLLAGIIVGGFIGQLVSQYVNLPIFNESVHFGTGSNPVSLNLIIADVVLGLNFIINFGTVLGVVLGIALYVKT